MENLPEKIIEDMQREKDQSRCTRVTLKEETRKAKELECLCRSVNRVGSHLHPEHRQQLLESAVNYYSKNRCEWEYKVGESWSNQPIS